MLYAIGLNKLKLKQHTMKVFDNFLEKEFKDLSHSNYYCKHFESKLFISKGNI